MASSCSAGTSQSNASSSSRRAGGTAETYYDILGVSETASLEQLRDAYMRRALEEHPDRNPTRVADATARFQAVADAYFTLSDTQRRAAYDADLRAQRRAAPEAHQDANGIFGDVFRLVEIHSCLP
jgi:DnaJ-class molecular chaperone